MDVSEEAARLTCRQQFGVRRQKMANRYYECWFSLFLDY
jgi:hypothetical protein